jgi:hypothetical protein
MPLVLTTLATLGRRILRAETAAIDAATLTLDALGALDSGPDA